MAKIQLYIGIWIALVVATIVEVVLRLSAGTVVASAIILILLFIAGGKAITIAMYYQHLRYESWRLAVLPIAAVIGVTILGLSAAYSLATGMW